MALWGSTDKKRLKKVDEDGCMFTVGAEIPPEEVEGLNQNALVQIQARARLPGFRKGKAPLKIIESHFGDEVRQKVLDQAARKILPKAIELFDLKPVATPFLHRVQFEKGKPLTFQLTFEISPKFEPKSYKDMALARKAPPPAEQTVEERLRDLRESNARLETAEEEVVGKDHYVVVDYEGAMEGASLKEARAENELIDMSVPQTMEGLAEGLLGAKRNATREIKVMIKGKTVSLRATVKEIKKKVWPALDDDFAKDLGFPSLDDLKKKILEVGARENKQQAEREIREQIDKKLIEANPIPLPPSIVSAQAASLLERLKDQWTQSGKPWPEKEETELLEKLRPDAESQVHLTYVLQAIARKENLEATEEDLALEREANLKRVQAAEEKERLKELFVSQRDNFAAVIRQRKVYDHIRENAKIREL